MAPRPWRRGPSAQVARLGRRVARWPRGWLDRWLLRRPFEGLSGRRYAALARPAFERFDERVLDQLPASLIEARWMLDVGAGPATFALAAARRYPQLRVLALEPSHELARTAAVAVADLPRVRVVRARAEQLPLADGAIALAVCLSSLRHFADRGRALAELRRVLAPGGTLVIIELDPRASPARIAHHARGLSERALRAVFGALVVRTAPPVEDVIALAERAGFLLRRRHDDPWQPLYLLELTPGPA